MNPRRQPRRIGPRDLTVADVVEPLPSTPRMVGRALVRRCPRCGSGGQFRYWLKRTDHCPGCGYTLDRETDSFYGAFLINLCVTFALLFGLLIAMVGFEAANNPLPLELVIIVGVIIAVAVPLVFYPFAFTLWMVIDLHSDPLQVSEIADAAEKVGARDDDAEADRGAGP